MAAQHPLPLAWLGLGVEGKVNRHHDDEPAVEAAHNDLAELFLIPATLVLRAHFTTRLSSTLFGSITLDGRLHPVTSSEFPDFSGTVPDAERGWSSFGPMKVGARFPRDRVC